jgi:hypothetical protein
MMHDLDSLPYGWFVCDPEESARLHQELQIELPPGHRLFDVPVRVVAHRDGTDDILCQHIDDPARYTVIHLTWIMKPEIGPGFPTVEVDGDFAAFLAYERAFLE